MRDLQMAMREIAVTLVTSTDEYIKIMQELENSSPDSFPNIKKKAFSMGLVLAQISAILAEITPQIKNLPQEQRPTLPAIILLSSLSGSMSMIALAEDKSKLVAVPLLEASVINNLISQGPTSLWLKTMLALPRPERPSS